MPPNYPAGIHCDLPIYFWYLDPAHDLMSISCQTSARCHQKPGLACMDNSIMIEQHHFFSAGPQKMVPDSGAGASHLLAANWLQAFWACTHPNQE